MAKSLALALALFFFVVLILWIYVSDFRTLEGFVNWQESEVLVKGSTTTMRQKPLSNATVEQKESVVGNSNDENKPAKLVEILSPFQLALKNYTRLHQSITSNASPQKYIRLQCGGFCGGWGDRLKGVFNAIALSLMLDRAFLVDLLQAGKPLYDIYEPSPAKWNTRPYGGNVLSVRCVDTDCSCFINQLKIQTDPSYLDQYSEVNVITNGDCSGEILNIPSFREKRKQFAITSNSSWRGELMSALFKPTSSLEKLIQTLLKNGKWPEIAIHVRTGLIPGDPQRFKGDLQSWINSYVSCLEKINANFPVRGATVFIAVDNQGALDQLVSKVKNNGWDIVTASNIGQLGHVERHQVSNLALRMHAEFEMLRHAQYLLAGPSGFSLMAYKTRVLDNSKVFAGEDNCKPLFKTPGVGYFTVKYD